MPDVESQSRSGAIGQPCVLGAKDAICLYALTQRRHAAGAPAPEIGEGLHLYGVGAVAALIGIVPIAEYCGADAERNLADVAWLAPRVRRHAELVSWTMQRSPVYPVPFATFFNTFESLTAFMSAHGQTIVAFLDQVAGKEEWELRAAAQFDSPELLDRLACSAWPDWRALSKGVRYMRLCRDREALIDFGRRDAAAVLRGHVEGLRPVTADVRELGPGRQLDPKSGEPIARYALLVDRTNAAELRARVHAFAPAEAVAIVLSGPWAPFSFRPDLAAWR